MSSTHAGEHYEVVSTVGYLLGVQKKYFESETHTMDLEIYRKLEKEKNAKIIRALCRLRTQLEINFKKVCIAIQQDYKSIMTVPELIPQEEIQYLSENGVDA